MRSNIRIRAAGIVIACAAIAVPVSAFAASAVPAAPTAVHRCTATIPWIGIGADGGFAGGQGYVLEFSNTGKAACTIKGSPRVIALWRGQQVGRAARTAPGGRTVTLGPGATAHAVLLVYDASATCPGHVVPSSSLLVTPPGGAGNGAGNIEFGVGGMCRGKSTMFVGAIEAGTGIPGELRSVIGISYRFTIRIRSGSVNSHIIRPQCH